MKSFAIFDSEFLEYRETGQKYVFTIITNPLVLKDQDLQVHLMPSKEEKIAAVQLVENQEGKPLGTPKKNSFDLQSIGGPFWGWIISIIKKNCQFQVMRVLLGVCSFDHRPLPFSNRLM